MKAAWSFWCVAWLFLTGIGRADPTEIRFSQTLNAEERTASGLTRLSSDEVAVVDALVRRDTTSRGVATNDEKVAAVFSQRLTADERKTAGFAKLTAAELPKLDGFVERYQGAKLARTLLAPPTFLSRYSRVSPRETKKEMEIHGSFSLSYGVGSGGYSEKTGAMTLSLQDPARGYSITVGYAESHIKGGSVYRDLFYDPLRGGLETMAPLPP